MASWFSGGSMQGSRERLQARLACEVRCSHDNDDCQMCDLDENIG